MLSIRLGVKGRRVRSIKSVVVLIASCPHLCYFTQSVEDPEVLGQNERFRLLDVSNRNSMTIFSSGLSGSNFIIHKT